MPDTKRNHRGRFECQECAVEIEDSEVLCAAHRWILQEKVIPWLSRSRELLKRIQSKERCSRP